MTLKVFNFQCHQGHIFEGWFRSHDDYQEQCNNGLLNCPICGSKDFKKQLSAPHLNTHRYPQINEIRQKGKDHKDFTEKNLANFQAKILKHMRDIIRNTEDVGAQFAHEARQIHRGESQERPIRGVITTEERDSLAEEGIEVLHIPSFLDDTSIH